MTLYQTARAMLALAAEQQPGRHVEVDLGMLPEADFAALASESGCKVRIQIDGTHLGHVLESIASWDSRGIHALCSRPARAGDAERIEAGR